MTHHGAPGCGASQSAHQVKAYLASRKLTPEEGAALIAEAEALLAALDCC